MLAASASPVYEAVAELFTIVVAVAPLFHPAIVPSSVAKIKSAEVPPGIGNSPVALPTIPVGLPVPPVAPGTVTNGSDLKILPLPSISSETPVPSSLIQKGVPPSAEMNASPHALIVRESFVFAPVPVLPTRLSILNDETDSATVLRTWD